MKISIGCPPGPHARELALRAEELGYDRIWLFDSAAVYEDIWIHLAQIAEATTKIGLGTAVLVPSLRHVMTTASAIATVDRLAPGRLACAFGTGFTARRVLGQGALTWKYTREYIEQLRALLNGEMVEIEGAQCTMLHHPAMAKERPINVPLIISAFGPKGLQITREIGDGWIGMTPPPEPFDWAVQMMPGTVLDPGESPFSERAIRSAGPWHVGIFHSGWEWDREGLANVPGGDAFAEAINKNPEEHRHFAVHYGHVTHLNDADQAAFDAVGDNLEWVVSVGEPDEIRAKVQGFRDAGTKDIMIVTGADDYIRDAEKFMEAVKPLQG